MKKAAFLGLAVALAMVLTGVVYAHGPWGHGMDYGMDYSTPNVDTETLKKFQKETLSLRDELLTKKLELRNEYNKSVPDKKHIATLRKEIIDLQTKIQEISDKYGIDIPTGYGMMGRGMMAGMGCTCPMCQ